MHGNDAGVSVFPGRTGRGVRVAVIDSGVNPAHPHIVGVTGGVTIGDGGDSDDFLDTLGHGTAVMAAIQEKAPEAEYFAVRVFQAALRTNVDCLLRAFEWCIEQRMDVINLSLGTANPAHAVRFAPVVGRGSVLVAARESDGVPMLPGSLACVVGVNLDWDCPRGMFRCEEGEFYASGYPRSIPGVPKERNLRGISFAVANMTGFVAQACEGLEHRTIERIRGVLAMEANRIRPKISS